MIDIKYLKHNEIDKEKWDRVVACSDYSLPYFFSWYLDIVSPDWEALILDDYNIIMPLTVKHKYGIKYVIQPPFTQQLGILSFNKTIDKEIIGHFIKKIPYFIFDINLNYNNVWKESKINLVIEPNSYNLIRSRYNKNTKRNILKAINSDLIIKKIDLSQFIPLMNCSECKIDKNRIVLEKLLKTLSEKGFLYLRGVYKNDMIVAGLAAIECKSKFIYLTPISNEEGRKYNAMFLLLDDTIEYCMNSKYMFDFEGSMIPGVQRFYKGFGGEEQLYYRAHRLRNKKIFDLLHKMFRI